MKKSHESDPLAPRPQLDFSKGVRGKYSNLLQQGANVVIIDPVLMPFFPDSESVNRALHAFLAINDQVKSAANSIGRRSTSSATRKPDPEIGSQTEAAPVRVD